MSGLKDAARLLGYFIATAVVGALIAPGLFWAAHAAAAHGIFPPLAKYDFESFFHRALLIAAIAFLWPLLRSLRIRTRDDLGLERNRSWLGDVVAGFCLAAIPLLFTATGLITSHAYYLKPGGASKGLGTVVVAALIVPLIEEALFRGVFFAVLARLGERTGALLTSALFSILHFLKAPAGTSADPTWYSGFISIAHAFDGFRNRTMVLASFCTLFLIGCVLVHARIRTKSLWLPIGLHSGWILVAGVFGKFAKQRGVAEPWIGSNLLIGLVPLLTVAATWLLMIAWFRYARTRAA
ncbi:MAG: CPBP family intramembrane glutamic endopeptidase [Chthoniobacterales bacterium]